MLEDAGIKTLGYLYDYGDGWEHTIKVERIAPAEPDAVYPRLIEASGGCPPEDVGGPWGYGETLEALEDPGHERYAETLEWLGEDFNPNAFDAEQLEGRRRRPRKTLGKKTLPQKTATRLTRGPHRRVTNKSAVSSASFSADGSRSVTASADGMARVWDLRKRPPNFIALEGHHKSVNAASFSRDGTCLVTASDDGTARIWDLRDTHPSSITLEGHKEPVRVASFSPDGTHLVTASEDRTILLWDLRSKPPGFATLHGHTSEVTSASFSPDGSHLATASYDRKVGYGI